MFSSELRQGGRLECCFCLCLSFCVCCYQDSRTHQHTAETRQTNLNSGENSLLYILNSFSFCCDWRQRKVKIYHSLLLFVIKIARHKLHDMTEEPLVLDFAHQYKPVTSPYVYMVARTEIFAHLVMLPFTSVWIVDDLQVSLQNVNAVTSVEVVIEDWIVLILLPAGLHTLQLGHQPGLSVEGSRLKHQTFTLLSSTWDRWFTYQHCDFRNHDIAWKG